MRGNARKNNNTRLADEYEPSCPPHKRKDLDALIRQHKGNKEKIKEQIELWWEVPEEKEEQWGVVNKKSAKKQAAPRSNGGGGGYQGRGGRGGFRSGDRGGRGGHGRGMNGGRGGGADRDRRRDRNGDRDKHENRFQKPAAEPEVPQEKKKIGIPGPAPVKKERPLQGAWGQRAAVPAAPVVAAAAPVTVADVVASPTPTPLVEVSKPPEPEPVIDVGVVTAQDPTPAGLVENNESVQTPVAPPAPKIVAPPSGNVWATRGSAHIIQAEKPKPPPLPVSKPIQKQQPIVEQPIEIIEPIVESAPSLPDPIQEDEIIVPDTTIPLESELPASVNGANINAAGWKPKENNSSTSVDIGQPSPVGPVSVASAPAVGDMPLLDNTETIVQETIVAPVEEPVAPTLAVPTSIESMKPASALNLGHWETGDGEDNVSHDFGFGFGQENDVASVDEASNSAAANNVTSVPQPTPAAPMPATAESVAVPAAATVSPARPPPGLVLGMPPMPDQIVHVHELEKKIEKASIKKDDVSEKVDMTQSANKETSSTTQSNNGYAGQPTNTNEAFVQMPPGGVMSQQNYTGQYGMGMYGYNAQNPAVPAQNGFMGGVPNPATAPLLSTGLPQQKQQNVSAQPQGVGLPHQGGLYGSPTPANPTTETNTNNDSSNPTNPSPNNAGMPPGIPAGMPYNPALFYGQQPYQMGQHHGVGAYGFAGYGGQYNGIQAGFGYQQVMGQGAGYGQPYDDQAQHGNHTNNNNHQGGYNKNSGGYRGRNNHNNHHHQNQYQNQYNPQGHGGYGGQPYNMGYNDFNQRGGYGPGGHMDSSYMQNSGGYQSGFNQEDGQQMSKGKAKGGNRNFGSNNPNMHQYQQSNQQQQFGGLQNAGNGGVSDNNGNSGLNYQNWGGGGL